MFFLVVCSNLMYWYTLGFPAVVLLPALWAGSIAAEMFLQVCFPEKKHKRRLLTYLSLAMCLLCEVLIWALQANMLALAEAFFLSYHMAATVLLGSLIGKVGYFVMEKVQERRRRKAEQEE